MEETAWTLVVILTITLTVFLVMATVLALMLIRLVQKARKVADKAESAAENLVGASKVVKEAIQPATITAFLIESYRKLTGRSKHGKR
jgi:membrane protein implicated in regulation of membrane protease activity